ncbi:MAG: M20/M25/M40 family metallo-hydrolase [Myxococcota bacterium]|nr:M20/M25/M40 family metallo-hydrolase [Myxococcota bacterium]
MSTTQWAGPVAWAAALWAGFVVFQPPTIPETPSPGSFSADNARPILARVAAAPHPTGSAENAAVRDFLVEALREHALEPEVVSESVIVPWGSQRARGARVENIIARVPGRDSTGTVLLAAHYDSVPTGPGAGDDAVAVAAMVEVARLLAEQPVRNDILLLLTDAEELGLLGARAFVQDEDLLSEIAVVANFEARGGGGPSLLFETSDDNAWLIDAFSTAPNPAGNSMAYEVYRRMPNDTDFSVFRRAGLDGLNFGFIDRFPQYHAAIDTLEQLDERSLQHHGEGMLTLARALGDHDFTQEKQMGNAVFFSLPGVMIRYSSGLALPLALLGGLLAVGRLRKSAAAGAVFSLISVGLAGAVGLGIVAALQAYHPGMAGIRHPTMYDDIPWRIAIAAASLLGAVGFRAATMRWSDVEGMWAGGRLIWAVLAVACAVEAPGASYLLTWPLIAASAVPKRWAGPAGAVAVYFCAPTADQLFIALGLHGAPVAGAIVGLMGLLLVSERPRFLAAGAGAVFLMSAVLGSMPSAPSVEEPTHESLAYLQQDGEAVWLASEVAPWSAEYLSSAREMPGRDRRNIMLRGGFFEADAESLSLTRPILRTRSTIAAADRHWVRGTIYGKRDGCALTVRIDDTSRVVSFKIDGVVVETANGLTLSYFASLRKGVELDIEILGTEPLSVFVSEQTFSLPESVQRSETSIPVPWGFGVTDSSIVTTEMKL